MKKALLIFLLLYTFLSKAQVSKPIVNIQSPNAATLGLFGETPVSLFTGVPHIEIPLYQFSENGITIPISLSYHASGFRPDMHPGWVGMGWNLNTGGTISRIVKGDFPDEYKSVDLGANYQYAGFWYNYNVLNVPNWDQIAFMRSIAIFQNGNYAAQLDQEPDEFSFSFSGGNGKFYLDHTRQWRVKCDKPVKVTFNGTFLDVPFPEPSGTAVSIAIEGNFKSFAGFTITDEMGDKYIFGGNTNAIEYGIAFFGQVGGEWVAQNWHLTKIIHRDGYEVTLNYAKDDYINQMDLYVYQKFHSTTVIPGQNPSYNTTCATNFASTNPYYYSGGSLVSPSYLTNIIGTKSRVTFSRATSTELRYPPETYATHHYNWVNFPDPNRPPGQQFLPYLQTDLTTYPNCLDKLKWKKLTSIQIFELPYNFIKAFDFTYNDNPAERLTLLSLIERSGPLSKPPYQFFYDASVPLPPYLASKTDHWGFYNGTYASINNVNYYNYRQSVSSYLLAGTLNKIIYPTGGASEFIYEPHQYSKRLQMNRTDGIDASYNVNTLAGGLRIKKITSYDFASSTSKNTKEYFYINGYNNTVNVSSQLSSGILGGRIQYYYDDYRTVPEGESGFLYSQEIFSSQSVLPSSGNSMGSHIGYTEVTEKLSDGSYFRHFFTNFDNGRIDEPVPCLQVTRTPYEAATSLESERGKLLKREDYNGLNILLRKIENQYLALNKSNEFVRGVNTKSFKICPPAFPYVLEGVAYRLYTYSYVPSTETITQYDQNGQNPIVTQRNLTYNNQYRQIAKEDFLSSKQQSTTTYYRYPYDILSYTPAASATSNETTAFMIQNNYLGMPVEVINTKVINSIEQVIGSKITNFKSFSGRIKPAYEYKFESAAPVLKSSYSNYAITGFNVNEIINKDSRTGLELQFDNYDSKGNILQYKDKSGIPTSFEWGYNQLYPVVKAINATNATVSGTLIKEFYYQGFEEQGGNATTTPYVGKNYYKGYYNVPYTKPNAKQYKINYHYLETGTGVWKNNTKDFTNNMLLADGDAIDEIRVYPADAFITTYTYKPIVGMTSQTDPNGKTIFYEYDAFQRLALIRNEDGNILKKICYNYAGQIDVCEGAPSWQLTGYTRCKPCPSDSIYPTNILQNEQKDLNPNSPTYNQTQWIDAGINSTCITSVWVNQGSPYCELNVGDNTGNQLQLQKDMNPCSATYNQTQVILLGYNPSACPLPGCSGNNCYAEGYKCVYGNCELGYKVYTSSYYDWFSGMVICTYHYEWSDYTWSGDYQEYSNGFCPIQ